MATNLIIEIGLDGGPQRFSFEGVATDDGRHFYGALVTVSEMTRGIQALPGDVEIQSHLVEIANADNRFSQLRATEAWKNRAVTVWVGDEDDGTSAFKQLFGGLVSRWSFGPETFTIEVVDPLGLKLDVPVEGRVTKIEFPALPEETAEGLLLPWLIGDLRCLLGRGCLPGYLVNGNEDDQGVEQGPWRYVLAQVRLKELPRVYVYGEPISEQDYALVDQTSPPRTFIDFPVDPRDPTRSNERTISYDAVGLTDDATPLGATIINPVDQLEQFLLANGFVAGDLDAASFAAAVAIVEARGLSGGAAIVDAALTTRDVIGQFAASFNLGIFQARSGLLGVSHPVIDASAVGDRVEVGDQVEIVGGGIEILSNDQVASALVGRYALSFVSFEWEASAELEDQVQTAQLDPGGRKVERLAEMPFVRDQGTANAVMEDRLFFLREERQLVTLSVIPAMYPLIEVGDDLLVTHHAGVAADGQGYKQARFRVLSVGIDVLANRMRLALVDLTQATFSTAKVFATIWAPPLVRSNFGNAFPAYAWPAEMGPATDFGTLE